MIGNEENDDWHTVPVFLQTNLLHHHLLLHLRRGPRLYRPSFRLCRRMAQVGKKVGAMIGGASGYVVGETKGLWGMNRAVSYCYGKPGPSFRRV